MQFLDFNFVNMFYIRKIKDNQRIMPKATNKEVGFSSQQHFQLLCNATRERGGGLQQSI